MLPSFGPNATFIPKKNTLLIRHNELRVQDFWEDVFSIFTRNKGRLSPLGSQTDETSCCCIVEKELQSFVDETDEQVELQAFVECRRGKKVKLPVCCHAAAIPDRPRMCPPLPARHLRFPLAVLQLP